MSRFTEFEAFEPVEGTKKVYQLTEEVVWEVGKYGSGWDLVLPVGFKFDISVPDNLEWVLDPHDRAVLMGAAVHDELLNQGYDAAFASSEFRRACIARGVSGCWAWMLFLTTFLWTIKWK